MFVEATDAVPYEIHGSRFLSYVAPASGSAQLCAWRLEVPAGSVGAAHRISHEEVLLVLAGSPVLTINDEERQLAPGDAALFPVGASVRVDNPSADSASAWVTTSVGLEAEMADGTRMSPPWVQ